MLLRYMVLMVIYCMNSYHHYQNHRTDQYGGDFNNRSRLLIDVFYFAVKKAASDKMCVGSKNIGD